MDLPVKPWPFMMRRDGISMRIKITREWDMKVKNINRIKKLVNDIFDMADTRIYYEGDADGLPGSAKDVLDEFGMMLYEEFEIDIDKILHESGLSRKNL